MADGEDQDKIEPTLDPDTDSPSSALDDDEGGGLDAKKIVLFILLPIFSLRM